MSVSARTLILTAALPALLFSLGASARQAEVKTTSTPSAAATVPAAAAPEASPLDPVAKLKKELAATDVAKGTTLDLAADVLFDFNQAGLRAEAAPTLEKLADLVRRSRKPVRISGHTDDKGNAAYNKKLTQLRAGAVKAALVQRGIRAGSIQTAGYGQERPKAANTNPDGSDNPKGRETNRRIEVLLVKG